MTVILVLAIVSLAVLVRNVWGFGDAMLALPLLSLLIGLEQAAPLMAMLSAVCAVWLLRERPELIERGMLVYATVRGWSGDELRVNLQAVFLPLALLTLGGHAVAGLWTREVVLFAIAALPAVALALVVGPRLRERLASRGGERILYGLILLLGVAELVRGL